MQATILYGPRDVRVEERPDPTILESTDAIIRIAAACVCGSDLWPYRGVQTFAQPTPMGHEYCGIVEAVGKAVLTIRPGQFVVGSFAASDNTCAHCHYGYHSSCMHREFLSGTQAPLFRVPLADGTLVPTADIPPDHLIPSLLATSDVLGTGWFAADAANVRPGATVAVVDDAASGPSGGGVSRDGRAARDQGFAASVTAEFRTVGTSPDERDQPDWNGKGDMDKRFGTRHVIEPLVEVGRRNFLKLTGAGVAAGVLSAIDVPMFAQTLAWDKTFPKSDRVDHRKVSFYNRLGIALVADLYTPKNIDRSQRQAALVVGGPFGAVKEQSSGLYAQTMAERGLVTIAHDPSYVGESGGQPHGIASSEALVEDFSAGVDFLGGLPFVDRDRIGVLGVCGSGGFGLAAAEIDPRIKAVATVSMYDIGQAKRQGLAPTPDAGAMRKSLNEVAAQRWAEVDGAERAMVIGTPQVLTASSTEIDREFYDYYRTPRGQHPRSTTAFSRTSDAQMMLFWSYQHLDWMSPRPVLFITGDRAHSRIFSEHARSRASEPKELFIVPGAGHVDLYDRVNLIPWDKLQAFFGKHLPATKVRSAR